MKVVAALFVIVAASGSIPGALVESPPLVRVDAFYGWGPSWSVAVWPDGAVEIKNTGNPERAGKYVLPRERFLELTALLDRERPWEMSGALGTAVIDGPLRSVKVHYRGHDGKYDLYVTPPGAAGAYPEGTDEMMRALRVCEAVRHLALDPAIGTCVDEASHHDETQLTRRARPIAR